MVVIFSISELWMQELASQLIWCGILSQDGIPGERVDVVPGWDHVLHFVSIPDGDHVVSVRDRREFPTDGSCFVDLDLDCRVDSEDLVHPCFEMTIYDYLVE